MQKVIYSFSKFFQGYVSKNALVSQDFSFGVSELCSLIATIK